MNKIAIDIVLLMPEEINKLAIDLSSKIIPPENTKPLRLGMDDYLPHVSLLMGTIFTNDIEKLKNKIESIIKKYLPLKIIFTEINNGNLSYLDIEKNKQLNDLRSEIAQVANLDYDADASMIIDSEIEDGFLDWINNFKENNVGEDKFSFHLTIGAGNSILCKADFPTETTINTVAICHLGYKCSCRKVLVKIQ